MNAVIILKTHQSNKTKFTTKLIYKIKAYLNNAFGTWLKLNRSRMKRTGQSLLFHYLHFGNIKSLNTVCAKKELPT